MSNRCLSIPNTDAAEFAAEKQECRKEVHQLLRVMGKLLARNGKGIGEAIAEQASYLGLSTTRLRAIYDEFRGTNDWRVLVDRRRYPAPGVRGAVPKEVIEEWQRLAEGNQRKSKPAHRKLIRMWQRGELAHIAWPPIDPETGIPMGCTYRNLLRHRPDDAHLSAMRDGLGVAMAKHGPKVLTTRVGLWVGSHYVIDDVKRDLKVLLIGKGGQDICIQELGIMDLYSADRFAVHRRPQYLREDGTKDSIKEREMRFLIASMLRHDGYSPRGTQIVAEKGTAAVRKPLEKWLNGQSNGLITVRGPGITGREQAIAGYWGAGKGNPRHKAGLESHHNLLHNEAADLPAPVGHDRKPPEWLHGIEAATGQVLNWLRTLPPEQAALLSVPMLEYWQALALLSDIDHRIAWRTDHNLQGWVECGHTLVEFCRNPVTDDWVSPQEFAALPEGEQRQLAIAVDRHPTLRRARKMAPREVRARGAGELIRFADAQIALMFCDRNLGDDLRQTKRLTADGMLKLQDTTVEPEAMHFSRELMARDGGTVRLDERTDYGVVLNPFDVTALWVYGAQGDYLGTAPRIHRASPIVVHEIHQELGRRSHEKAAMLAPLAERHADTVQLIRTMQEENAAIARGATPEVREAQREAEKMQRSAVRLGELIRVEAARSPHVTESADPETPPESWDATPSAPEPNSPTETNHQETW